LKVAVNLGGRGHAEAKRVAEKEERRRAHIDLYGDSETSASDDDGTVC
jgi:hypothetical protein